jgi:hypothetical protein
MQDEREYAECADIHQGELEAAHGTAGSKPTLPDHVRKQGFGSENRMWAPRPHGKQDPDRYVRKWASAQSPKERQSP